jgi:putative hydrolases of HD superfamily
VDPLLETLLALGTLEHLPRTGWLQRGIVPAEPVAAHILGCAYVTLALAARVEPPLDVERCATLALVHDAPEALIGDLPRSATRLLPAGAKATAEARSAQELLAPLSSHALAAWDEYQAAGTREARLVRLADRLHLGLRLLAYLRSGRRGLGEFVDGLQALDAGEFLPAEELRRSLLTAIEAELAR